MRTLLLVIVPHDLARLRALVASVAAVLLCACGGGATDSGPTGTGAAGGAAPAGGETSTVSGNGNGSSGSSSAGSGTGGNGVGGTSAAACPRLGELTLAIHVVVDVTWPDTLGAEGGSGKLHAWNLARMTANGTSLDGITQPCGSDLPELTLKPLIGGGKFDIDVPDAVWDAPSAPKTATMGTISGFDIGSTLSTDVTNLLVGLTMSDADGPWPDSHGEVMTVDADGDDEPGFTGIPKTGSGYVQPPVTVSLIGESEKADEIYMVSRTAMGLDGTVSSCTEQSGTVTVKFFDNHIVGCHVAGGGPCTAEQVDFLDTNRNQLTATGGTFTSKLVPAGATCADARGI
jgi:hypothetical protein